MSKEDYEIEACLQEAQNWEASEDTPRLAYPFPAGRFKFVFPPSWVQPHCYGSQSKAPKGPLDDETRAASACDARPRPAVDTSDARPASTK